jgi:hypothetical protein
MTHRWLARWGGMLLVALVAVAAAWLWMLPPLPAPVKLPARPPLDQVTASDAENEPSTTFERDSRLAATSEPAGLVDESSAVDGARHTRAPTPRPSVTSGPVVDVRRVQEQKGVPTGAPRPESKPATRADEFDRSPGARQRGVAQFGGSVQTESAVEAGLAWLAAHQSADGIWDRLSFADRDPPDDRCDGQAIAQTETPVEAGLTGLCLLAFLGAGYTDAQGPYQQNVRTAVDALLQMQRASGGFLVDEALAGYNDALATFALAEYYAMRREPRLVEPLRRAVRRLASGQQALGGWDYLPLASSGRNDTSITAWMVQALHACAAAGIEVPRRTLVGAALHFARATEPDGRVWYADAGTGLELDASQRPRYRYGPAMTAAGLACEQLLGWHLDGPLPHKQAAILFSQPPSAAKARGRDRTQLHSEYYWYYATVAMFQRGGQEWERWNGRLRDAILPLQNREKTPEGRKRSAYGSWDPYGQAWGKWGKMGSRVYTTAICVLTLEIYYRHTPAYLTEETLLDVSAWREYLKQANPRQRREAVACLANLRLELGEAALVELLGDADRAVALAAAEALAELDSPLGLKVLEDVLTTLPPWGRRLTEQALQRAREITELPPAEGRVRVFDPQRRLATLELSRAYVGMPLSIRRNGNEVARLRVVQRFSGQALVVAELVEPLGDTPPQTDDVAVGR